MKTNPTSNRSGAAGAGPWKRRPGRALSAALSLLWLALGAPASAGEETRVFQAGAATSNISPPLGLPIVGGWSPSGAKHIHDELHARCLVLDDGTTRIAFVVCDNLGIPREVILKAKELAQSNGVRPLHANARASESALVSRVSCPGVNV